MQLDTNVRMKWCLIIRSDSIKSDLEVEMSPTYDTFLKYHSGIVVAVENRVLREAARYGKAEIR
jgi:hypothetical protein